MLIASYPFVFNISTSNFVSSATCQIRIWYQNINQPPIIANATFSIHLFSPNHTFIGRVFAVDPDHNQQITFSLSGMWLHECNSHLRFRIAL